MDSEAKSKAGGSEAGEVAAALNRIADALLLLANAYCLQLEQQDPEMQQPRATLDGTPLY